MRSANAIGFVKHADPVFETPITVRPDAAVAEVLSLLGKRAHGAAVVVDGGRPVGIITERDCHEVDRFARAAAVMTTEIVVVGKDVDLRDAFDLMAGRHLDVVPVLDGDRMLGRADPQGRAALVDLHARRGPGRPACWSARRSGSTATSPARPGRCWRRAPTCWSWIRRTATRRR